MWQASFKPLGIPQWKKKIPTLKGKWSNLRFLANPHSDALNSWCLQLNMPQDQVCHLPATSTKIPATHQRSPSWETAPYPSRDWTGEPSHCRLYQLNPIHHLVLLALPPKYLRDPPASLHVHCHVSRPWWSPPWTGRMDALTRPAWFNSQRDLFKIHLPVHHSPAHNTSMASCCIWTQRHLSFSW